MKQFFLIFLMSFVTCTYAQVEFNNKFKGIPPVKIQPKEKKNIPPPVVDTSTIIPPNVYKNPNIQSPSDPLTEYRPKVKSEISMLPTDEFLNPNEEVKDRLSRSVNKDLVNNGLKENDSYIRKTDIDFGIIRTKSPYLVLRIRDYGAIDGDLIRTTMTHDYKEEVLANNLFLEGSFKDVKINLQEGFSFLDIMALNRGALGGNTGAFVIYDDKGAALASDSWDNIDAGVKSKFKIIKE